MGEINHDHALHVRSALTFISSAAARGAWDAAALHRLAILAKLADAAATFLECGCVLAVSGAPETARVVLKRHFPRTRCLDDGVLRGAGSPKAKLRDDELEPEWPAQCAQNGPLSKHAFERKRRNKQTNDREKKIAARELRKKLKIIRPSTTAVSKTFFGKSTADKQIRKLVKNRPITPSIISHLEGITLHRFFEEKYFYLV